MKYLILFSLFLLTSFNYAEAANNSCAQRFTGFFNREFAHIPELSWQEVRKVEGDLILQDINSAQEIGPTAPIAASGFAGIGKCFVLSLASAETVGNLVQLDFNIAVFSLKDAHAAAWYLSNFSINELASPKCDNLIDGLINSATKSLAKLNTYYQDNYFKLELPNSLAPIAKKLFLTKDGKFLLSKYYLGASPGPKPSEDLFQFCAYPILN